LPSFFSFWAFGFFPLLNFFCGRLNNKALIQKVFNVVFQLFLGNKLTKLCCFFALNRIGNYIDFIHNCGFVCCWGWTRTNDLLDMNPTSYLLLFPTVYTPLQAPLIEAY